jgi:hypothetical protein
MWILAMHDLPLLVNIAVRRESYDVPRGSEEEHGALARLIDAAQDVEIIWAPVERESPFATATEPCGPGPRPRCACSPATAWG